MKFFSIVFFATGMSQYDFLKYRHNIDSRTFSVLEKRAQVKFLKLKEPNLLIGKKEENEMFFNGKNKFFFIPFSLYRYVRLEKPNILFIHGFVFPFQVVILNLIKPKNTKVVVQHHAEKPFTNKIKLFLQRIAYVHADAYLFASKQLSDAYVREKIIKHKSKIHEVMEGSSVFKVKNKLEARRKLKLPDTEIFLWVGRLDRNKDPMTVLKALNAYKNLGKDFKLYMIYATSELEGKVSSYIKLNALSPFVTLIGKVPHPDLEDWFNAADYFLAASHYEGSGIALCESMGCGCIPIVSNIPSFMSMTDSGSVGYIFETGNDNSLLKVFLSLNRSKLDGLRERVLRKFKEDLSFEAIGFRISNIVDEL